MPASVELSHVPAVIGRRPKDTPCPGDTIMYANFESGSRVSRIITPALAHAAITIDMVTVGNPGNAADTIGYGAVSYGYQIGTYEITAWHERLGPRTGQTATVTVGASGAKIQDFKFAMPAK